MPIEVQAKNSKSVQPTGIPAGSKALKPQLAKTAEKGTKKQDAAKKNSGDNTTGNNGDKNEKSKPQVTHELSMVCFF